MGSLNNPLEVRALSVKLDAKKILNSLTFLCRPGEFVGLIGPNGSGKTTLLKTINHLIPWQAGEIKLFNRSTSHFKAKERARRMAFMIHEENGFYDLPVIEVVVSGRYPYKRTLEGYSDPDYLMAQKTLGFVGLAGFETRLFPTLSTGEKQLAVLARTLLQDTDIILLDEPTSNLDIKHQDQIFTLGRELALQGKTVLAAIHNLDAAARYCHRLIVLNHGRIVRMGAPQEIFTPELVKQVWDVDSVILTNPVTGTPVIQVVPGKNGSHRE